MFDRKLADHLVIGDLDALVGRDATLIAAMTPQLPYRAGRRTLPRRCWRPFPALKKLENLSEAWARLQYREGQAVREAMLILMREHRVPSFSMYDGIIVPQSKADIATVTLKQLFKDSCGRRTKILTVETAEPTRAEDL